MVSILISYLYPILSVTVSAGVVPFVVKFLIAHTSAVNLAKDIKTAGLIYDALEEDGRLGELADTKLTSFINAMKSRTKLSDEDILLLNKSLAGVANAGKEVVIKELTPVEENPIVAQVKYVDAQGNELVQKVVPVVV